MSDSHADNLREFADEFGHLWDDDRVRQVLEAAVALNHMVEALRYIVLHEELNGGNRTVLHAAQRALERVGEPS